MIDINYDDRHRAIRIITELGLRVMSSTRYGNRIYLLLDHVPAGIEAYLAAELAA